MEDSALTRLIQRLLTIGADPLTSITLKVYTRVGFSWNQSFIQNHRGTKLALVLEIVNQSRPMGTPFRGSMGWY
jgi:hypothetical protein